MGAWVQDICPVRNWVYGPNSSLPFSFQVTVISKFHDYGRLSIIYNYDDDDDDEVFDDVFDDECCDRIPHLTLVRSHKIHRRSYYNWFPI